MKIKKICDLSVDEYNGYIKSELFRLLLNNYALCGPHLDYYKEYFGKEWDDLSLVAFDNEDYYLGMYFFYRNGEFSFFGSPINIYMVHADAQKEMRVYQELFAKLECLKKEYNAFKIKIYENQYFTFKYFDKFDTSLEYYSYIDLAQNSSEIKMAVRKSYKSLINWGYRNLDIKIFNSTNITIDILEQFEEFHIHVSGRRTRSHASWILQYNAVKEGMGYIVFGYLNNELVASVLVLNSLSEAYYGVAVNNRELMGQNLPIGHTVLIEAILEAKRLGFKIFNLGNVSSMNDDKLDAIAKYKRGFSPIIKTKIVYNIIL